MTYATRSGSGLASSLPSFRIDSGARATLPNVWSAVWASERSSLSAALASASTTFGEARSSRRA